MPANLVHCQTCRTLLNHELSEDSIETPEFVPLRELNDDPIAVVRGHYIECPGCSAELRVHQKYAGIAVQCRHCKHPFTYNEQVTQKAIFTPCPHCSEELRASVKYLGQKVACRFCNGAIQLRGQDRKLP
jgi:predicted nucleic acid-binding Zn ribbon protein